MREFALAARDGQNADLGPAILPSFLLLRYGKVVKSCAFESIAPTSKEGRKTEKYCVRGLEREGRSKVMGEFAYHWEEGRR